jgi:hypothetical protein
MGKKKHSNKQRYLLSKALLIILSRPEFGWVKEGVVSVPMDRWTIDFKGYVKIRDVFFHNLQTALPSDPKGSIPYRNYPEGIYRKGRISTSDNLLHTWKGIFSAKHWPEVDTVEDILTLGFYANRGDKATFREFTRTDLDAQASLKEALGDIKQYMRYLDMTDEDQLVEFIEFLDVRTGHVLTTIERVEHYVEASIEYIQRYINKCDSSAHIDIFEAFKLRILIDTGRCAFTTDL